MAGGKVWACCMDCRDEVAWGIGAGRMGCKEEAGHMGCREEAGHSCCKMARHNRPSHKLEGQPREFLHRPDEQKSRIERIQPLE